MIEEKTRIRIVAVALLLFFTLPHLCRSQKTNEPPRWLKPMLANSRSVPADGEELLSRDFSSVLADKRTGFIGYIGQDYYKMDICFRTVTKESDTSYRITGWSKVRANVCNFAGSVRITDVRELNEPEYGADDFMKGRIKRQGVCIGRYRLEESRQQKGSGVFSGTSVFRWYIDETDRLHYDDVNEDADDYANNQFAGTWKSYATGKKKKCAWGQFRIPDSGDLDIGAAEFSVNPAYAANGWIEGASSSGRPDERISEYGCMPPEAVNTSYKVIGKEAGAYYCLSINGKEYRIPDMMDYGDPDLKVYTRNGSTVLLVGLIDLYASVYFVYHFREGVLTRLGQIDIEQPADVEESGVRTISFRVTRENDKLVVKSYLDEAGASKNEFPLNGFTNTKK